MQDVKFNRGPAKGFIVDRLINIKLWAILI